MDEPSSSLQELLIVLFSQSFSVTISLVVTLFLLLCSALISGAEVAFFSLNKTDKIQLEESEFRSHKAAYQLLQHPKRLLATILIGNNLVNVSIIILSTFISNSLLTFENPILIFIFQVVIVTFLILLIGEVIPKVYANKSAVKFACFMAFPLMVMKKLFNPISYLLISSTSTIEKKFKKTIENISVEELSNALELATDHNNDTGKEEQKILEGIIKFGDTDVKQIMTPRMDVIALNATTNYTKVMRQVVTSGFSRIPVFKETFDTVEGFLYIKDLLPHLNEKENFDWVKLIKQPFFVPENKKIDDLLKEFQEKKIHLAVVVDEYGGSSGIVTLEDIIEEIVGDITDEFDVDTADYTKVDDNNYIFEGKIPLKDMYRILNIEGNEFEKEKGEADTLAGFMIEIAGKILLKNEKVFFKNYNLTVLASDKRRIKSVNITLPKSVTLRN